MTFTETVKRHWKWFAPGVLVVLVVAGVALASFAGWLGSDDEEVAADQPTAQVSQGPTLGPTPTIEPSPEPKPEIDIATTRSMAYTPVWNPPDGGQDFWQVVDPENGYPRNGGTDYVLAHACADRECAGNRIRTLDEGDVLTYRGEAYLVEEKLEIHKSQIADQDIWHHDADRLVVITCILDPETGLFNENDIIVATRAS